MMKRIFSASVILASFLTLCVSPSRAQSPAVAKDVIASLKPFIEDHVLAGAVLLVASPGKILSLEAIGSADLAAQRPMKTDDLFWIASMSKPMTATALMMLVDEGKVKLDDPVEKYLRNFKGMMVIAQQDQDHMLLQKAVHPITVWNVLTHTSGLPPRTPIELIHIDELSLENNVLSYAMSPLKFEPGSKWEYSNAGINTAGRIIEVVSGMPYEKFMQERLFTPLGMNDTTFWPSEEQVRRLAKSYQPDGTNGLKEIPIDQLSYPLANRGRGACPAGGLFSTASDVSLFCRMILNQGSFQGKRYLSEAAVRQMTTTQFLEPPGLKNSEHGYGFGWACMQKDHGQADFAALGTCGHGGAYSTDMSIDRKNGLITVFMVQQRGLRSLNGNKRKIQDAYKEAVHAAFVGR